MLPQLVRRSALLMIKMHLLKGTAYVASVLGILVQ